MINKLNVFIFQSNFLLDAKIKHKIPKILNLI